MHGSVGQMSSTVASILDEVLVMQRSMPKALGYTWESDVASSHVHIEDIRGRKIVLPIVLCRTEQTIRNTVKIMFSDHPGWKNVVEGNFELVDSQSQLTVFDGRPHHDSHYQ